MTDSSRARIWVREELLHLLSLSGTMAGLCITAVTLFYTVGRESKAATIVDDMLVLSALVFLLCSYVIFFALRTKTATVATTLESLADILLAVGLTLMVATGVFMVYTIW
jgi:uncharacterized membrane protein